jgi:preprotein translocase subunit YajC
VDSGFLVVIAVMFLIMYLLLIRPQRQQQRRHAEMVNSLKPGDEVITAGGIYGDITGVEEDRVTLEIAEDVEIEVAKRAIASVVPSEEFAEDEPDEADVVEPEGAEREASEPEPEADAVRQEDAARR